MADYGSQQGRDYGRHNPNTQRDAAFSHIFGAAPPPGRSQTMTSQSYQPPHPDRAQTMATQSPQRPPPRQYPGQPQQVDAYQNPYPQNPRPQNPYPQQRVPSGPPPPRPSAAQRMPPPQSPAYPGQRRPYGYPQRLDTGQPIQQGPMSSGPVPNRYPGPPGPALASDPFRSQSMATQPRPQFSPNPGPAPYNMSPAHAFRQQPYANAGHRTTAQGRIVPERPDERTMSMTSYARDHEHTQTMSGRIIPTRQRLSNEAPTDRSSQGSFAAPSSPVSTKQRTASQSSMASRSMSMASTTISTATTAVPERPSPETPKSSSQSGQTMTVSRRAPLVYPALLSRVAECFQERINLSDLTKDGLDYKNAFTGEDAVTLIAYIIKTTDRNLALLLGRSLDAQKFFHDVTYAHRLRDMRHEIYQFRETLQEEQPEVNGVFTLLTECYSPTCTRDRLCYSIACPRRLEQQARLNMRVKPVLKADDSGANLHDDQLDDQNRKLWINTVSKEIADSLTDREKKRQEIISELMYTERDFVKDLEYMRDFWMKPLRNPMVSPIPEVRRDRFVRTVFSNALEVYAVNSRLAEALTRRQQERPVVQNVGDIFLEIVPRFSPFITYGASQLYGKYEFENEKRSNPAFARFVDETERLKESRKLELNGYLTKPTTRLARYPLLLEGILKYTADDSSDKEDIPKTIAIIKDFLGKVNEESGKAENRFNLMQLDKDLKFRPGEFVDLKLTDEHRQLIFKGMLKKTPQESTGDIQAFLFDHAVLLVRIKTVNKREELRVYRKPIPLELLTIAEMTMLMPKMGITKRPSSSLATRTQTMSTQSKDPKAQYPITFKHLGKGGYEQTLFCSTAIQQQKWMEHIEKQQTALRLRSNIFTKETLSEGFFNGTNRVNCCVPIDGGRKLVIGTDFGVFLVDRKPKDASFKPSRVLDIKQVTQIDVLENYSLLLVLTEKTLYSYPLEALSTDPSHQPGLIKRGRKFCHANFFKAGVCQGQQLVCCVKTSALSSTIRVYEPMDSMIKKSKKSGFTKLLAGNDEVLKTYKEFYIPTESSSIHFLRSKLCVGCARGFEIVSLETLETQELLDQADTSLDFVAHKETSKPIYIERMGTEFLLCYCDYSFYVNRNGWRTRPDWMIQWEGTPQSFAIFNPYILAFEPNFVEIRNLETSALMNIITAKNIRMLHSSSREILYAYEDELGEDVIASIDFWPNQDGKGPANGAGGAMMEKNEF
ncbi:citron like protein [Trichodelitschia bisporula]|uniref:Citron like protein n=1 Tax=Trichodelitschia bisporula TaxID=703511 RepID=A0A6G1HHN1_9PEZI|nr:citron like protein [Trichodelitschia bisporula]